MSEASARLRRLEADHGADGWPAVQMRDITQVLDEHEAYRDELGRLMSVVGDEDFEIIRNLLGYSCDLFGERIVDEL